MPGTPHQACLTWHPARLALTDSPGQVVSSAVPSCMAISDLSFALRSLRGRDCRNTPGKHQTWRRSCQHTQLSLPPDGHSPAFPTLCLLSPITPQPALAFPWQWVLVWEHRIPSRCQGARRHTWSTYICTVSAKCLWLSVPLMECLVHGGRLDNH